MAEIAVSRTPLRIPFAGGLTDLHPYAVQFGGVTVSATIEKFIYVTVRRLPQQKFILRYGSHYEAVGRVEEIANPLIRTALTLLGMEEVGMEIESVADLPPESGLGSSGAFTVGLLKALSALQGVARSAESLAQLACHIEVTLLKGASGYHDATICALGGFQCIRYRGDGFTAHPVLLTAEQRAHFAQELLFFYTGHHAPSTPSLQLLLSQFDKGLPTLHAIKEVGLEAEKALQSADFARLGVLMGEQQRLKKMGLPGHFCNDFVVAMVEKIGRLGGYVQFPGGKVGAFMLIYAPKPVQPPLLAALAEYQRIPISFCTEGVCLL